MSVKLKSSTTSRFPQWLTRSNYEDNTKASKFGITNPLWKEVIGGQLVARTNRQECQKHFYALMFSYISVPSSSSSSSSCSSSSSSSASSSASASASASSSSSSSSSSSPLCFAMLLLLCHYNICIFHYKDERVWHHWLNENIKPTVWNMSSLFRH